MPREKGDYSNLLERIEEELDTDELTISDIRGWLGSHDKRGLTMNRIRLAGTLFNIATRERAIARSFSIGQRFAKEKGITLTDKVKAFVYPKFGGLKKEAVVIRGARGRFITWRYSK